MPVPAPTGTVGHMEPLGPALLGVAGHAGDLFPQHRSRHHEPRTRRPGRVARSVPVLARCLDLDEDMSSPRRARRFVQDACREWEIEEVQDDAVLVASELVGNALAHARTCCQLDLRLDAHGLTVAVRDHDHRGLLVPLACSTSGRRDQGLFLVASISRAWGVRPTENGKSVWALLPLPYQ